MDRAAVSAQIFAHHQIHRFHNSCFPSAFRVSTVLEQQFSAASLLQRQPLPSVQEDEEMDCGNKPHQQHQTYKNDTRLSCPEDFDKVTVSQRARLQDQIQPFDAAPTAADQYQLDNQYKLAMLYMNDASLAARDKENTAVSWFT